MSKKFFIVVCYILLALFMQYVGAKQETIIIIDPITEEVIQKYEQKWEDLELYFLGNTGEMWHYTIMDRDMGATEIYNQIYSVNVNTGSVGYYYQFGNNYGFRLSCYANSCNTFLSGENNSTSQIPYATWSQYMPSRYANNVWNSQSNWMGGYTAGDNVRGGAGDTSDKNGIGIVENRRGPCPEGYYIPSIHDWLDVYNKWSLSTESQNDGVKRSYDLLLSPIGSISYATHKLGEFGSYNRLLSSSNANYIVSNRSKIYTMRTRTSDGFHLRCFKNLKNKPKIKLNPNGGVRAVISVDGDVITSIGSPIKVDGSGEFIDFMGWYSTENFLKGTKVETGYNLRGGNNLYARWSGDKEVVLYEYNANGGKFSDGSIITGKYYEMSEEVPIDLWEEPMKIGNRFKGWYDEEIGGNKIEKDIVTDNKILYAQREKNVYKIIFDTDGGTEIKTITGYYGDNIEKPKDPIKTGYSFEGWDILIPDTIPVEDLVIKAKWKEIKNNGLGGQSGGIGNSGGIRYTSNTSSGTEAKNLEQPTKIFGSEQGNEMLNVHQRAYENGLTKYDNIEDSRLEEFLTREQMAKISSIFAIKFLEQIPNEAKRFSCSQYMDMDRVTEDLKEYVIESCELGYMGYMANGEAYLESFSPHTPVSVAQASIIISRMSRGNKYAINENQWYQGHLNAVYENGLVDDISKPFANIMRGDAFKMLYRLFKVQNTGK